jgi:quinol monooxygenase YgiN
MAEQSEPVTLIATFRATSGQHETGLGLISEYGKAVRQEPGNICFDIYTEQDDPHGFVIFEHYRDQSAFHEHLGGGIQAPLAESWADHSLTAPPLPAEHPVTTTGAGDASTAGLLFGLSQGATPDQAMALASACSAAVISGARSTRDTVIQLDSTVSAIFSPNV